MCEDLAREAARHDFISITSEEPTLRRVTVSLHVFSEDELRKHDARVINLYCKGALGYVIPI
jgi:hypothetical protein